MKKVFLAAFLFINIISFGQGLQSAGYVIGSGSASATATAFCQLNLTNQSSLTFSVTGTFSATAQVQLSVDNGVTWVNIATSTAIFWMAGNSFQSSGNITTTGIYTVATAGATNVRFITTSYTSGTINISAKAIQSTASVIIEGAAGVNILSGAAGIGAPPVSTDISNSVITTTTTTSAIPLLTGASLQISIQVSAVTGTGAALYTDIQESDDNGTTDWFTVYSFPAITAAGNYRSPKLPVTSNRVRYVQTVVGTSPSITRVLNRSMGNDAVNSTARQLIDRSTIVLTTLASATPVLDVANSNNVQLVVSIGAATTAPVLQLQASYDYGVTWTNIGTTLASVASSTVQYTLPSFNAAYLRAIVTTAGVTVTPNFVEVRAF